MEGNPATSPGRETVSTGEAAIEPFAAVLERHGLSLVRGETRTLQVSTGLTCNLSCRHCHLEAGPGRKEIMSRETMGEVIAFARRVSFREADITGGAPEMVPDLPFLIEGLAPIVPRIMLRTNLTALAGREREALLDLCIAKRVVLMASFPSTDPAKTDLQRGQGVADAGIAMLGKLNAKGYGVEGTGLELNLVSNPVGAHLPADQARAERKFKLDMLRKWGVTFNRLFSFANVPMGRYRKWLIDSGNHDGYMKTLAESFSPCTVGGLMCRTLISVSWDGFLFDCDFNLAAGRFNAGRRTHVSDVPGMPQSGIPIENGDYCYACTAGSGFT
ncbi:MAG: radical SAM protein [Actinobacteria bacterium]|nr:radical SAM protein [Actinomycetota bacterium]